MNLGSRTRTQLSTSSLRIKHRTDVPQLGGRYATSGRSGHGTAGYVTHGSSHRHSSGHAYAQGRGPSTFPWSIIAAAVAAVAALILLIQLVSCGIRGCSGTGATTATTTTASTESLAAVLAEASGATPDPSQTSTTSYSLTLRGQTLTNYDALVASVAERSSSYDSYAGLDAYESYKCLALITKNPQAANFVASLPEATGETQAFTGTVSQGSVPALYQWDERWGYKSYCDSALGFTGCGVTVMSMAYMGLTGKTDLTPADMADLAVEVGEASGGTNSTFFTNSDVAAATGVEGTWLDDVSVTALEESLAAGSLVAINLQANTLAGGGHWILAIGTDGSGTITIRDPNSMTNTAKAWDANELVGYANAFVALSLAS